MQHITSTGIKWLECYTRELKANEGVLILADVSPGVLETLKRSGALDVIGDANVIPATARVLASENAAWEAAQNWIGQRQAGTNAVAEGPGEP
jgi:STAS domain